MCVCEKSTKMKQILNREGNLRYFVNFKAIETNFWHIKLKASMKLFITIIKRYYKLFLLEMSILNLVVFPRTSKCHLRVLWRVCENEQISFYYNE